MEIATKLVLIHFCFAIIVWASAHSVEERLVFLERTSQLQMELLKTQQETIDQLQTTLKTQGEIVKTQQGTIDQLHRTLKTQGETVKTLQDTTDQLRRRSNSQGETVKTQQETIDQLLRTSKTQGETVKTQQETIYQLLRTSKTQGETVKTQQEAFYQLERTLQTQGVTVKTQQNTIDQIRRILNTQKKTDRHKVYENRALKTRMNMLVKREADSMKKEQENKNVIQRNDERTMWDSSASTIPSVSNRIKRVSANIAFHAYVTIQTCVNDNEIITFDREELDVAGGYNRGDGIYTVPESGTYVFTWTFVASGRTWYKTELLINGYVKGSNVAAANSDGDPQSATGTIVTSVHAGDHVYVRKASGVNCAVEHVYSRSTFSGWMLF